jgi:hypothetical protein
MANAVEVEIKNPCVERPILKENVNDLGINATAYSVTKELIERNEIESVLAYDGVISVGGYVHDDKKLEIVSDKKMRAYGWCFSVNGVIPDAMSDQVLVAKEDRIDWFLSYSTYDSGYWVDYCVPVSGNLEAASFICE